VDKNEFPNPMSAPGLKGMKERFDFKNIDVKRYVGAAVR
jgi:hypothetical protein